MHRNTRKNINGMMQVNLVMQHGRNESYMMMDNNRKEALDKARSFKAKQKMMVQAEMMKQLQPTVPEVTADSILICSQQLFLILSHKEL